MGSTSTCAPSVLEEGEHVEVAVTLGGLRPELTGDLDDRLHAQAVDLDGVDAVAAGVERIHILLAVEVVADLAESAADARRVFLFFSRNGFAHVGAASMMCQRLRSRSVSVRVFTASWMTRSVSPLFTSKGRTW